MKIKKMLYCFALIIAAILLSTSTVQADANETSLWSDLRSTFTRDLTIYKFTGTMLTCISPDASLDILINFIMTFLHKLGPNPLPSIISPAPEGNNISDTISRGKIASVPEPLTLLLLGTGLMGIAFYRRYKNK